MVMSIPSTHAYAVGSRDDNVDSAKDFVERNIGDMTVKWVKEHWKYLRDAYMKARKVSRQYVPSGSSTDSAKAIKKHSFRFFERMKFLEISLQTES
ncbi:hypothetical protein ALC57_02554 [Trachymyrmex cornetzi]|uniref:MADF domain-containing protein n=1 Tax=Trachymyrmex cornetzi TaxID=471704 RepID=A0A151JNG6_9HYME|nr:hypothetical protein ALC57_02554 [Trachymyrmex cornetzi]